MTRKVYFLFVFFITIGCVSFAQQGYLKGKIIDKDANQPLIGAHLIIYSGDKYISGASTDLDGNYIIKLNAGVYKAVCSFIAYDTIIQMVTIKTNDTTKQDFALGTANLKLDEVVVKRKLNRESENVLMIEQKKAAIMQENIGAKELSRKGVSDVAGGVKKVTGISMIGSRQLFVRGLGDRYNKTQLNGMPIASPNPDEKLIPLDLFPVNVVQSISVNKVYSVKNFADYSGALINIKTKDYPEKKFLSVGIGTGINTQTTFKDFRVMDNPGGLFLGTGTKQRNESLTADYKKCVRATYHGLDKDPFATGFNFSQVDALPKVSFDVAGGNRFKLKNGHEIGFIFTSSFGNDYTYTSGLDNVLRSDGTGLQMFSFEQYGYATTFANLGSVTYKKGNHKITYNLLYLNSSEDVLNEKSGNDKEQQTVFIRTNSYHNHALLNNQLLGEHKFGLNDKIVATWNVSASNANSYEPDRRGMVFEEHSNDTWTLYSLNQQETMRFFGEMDETIQTGGIDLSYRIGATDGKHQKGIISIGAQGVQKQRDFYSYTYYYDIDSIENIVLDYNSPEAVFNNDAFAAGDITLKNGTNERDKYFAELQVFGAYINLNYNLTPLLNIDFGVRMEKSYQKVIYWNDASHKRKAVLDTLIIYPALNMKYTLSDKSNLRLAASQTLTRPDFKEMAPFQYRPSYGSETYVGNGEINNTINYNLDLKYEIFPKAGDMISVGLYGKLLKTPIERIASSQAGSVIFTFQNVDEGRVLGSEVEFKKKISDRIQTGFNVSYIFTYIIVPENSSNTYKERPMEGASPYLINADLGYRLLDKDSLKLDFALIYNVYGKRIYAVGDGGRGDNFEMPFHMLNFIAKMHIKKNMGIGFKINNILNSNVAYIQDKTLQNEAGVYDKTGEAKKDEYKKGTYIGFSFSYKF